jgi:hypothetical protein
MSTTGLLWALALAPAPPHAAATLAVTMTAATDKLIPRILRRPRGDPPTCMATVNRCRTSFSRVERLFDPRSR